MASAALSRGQERIGGKRSTFVRSATDFRAGAGLSQGQVLDFTASAARLQQVRKVRYLLLIDRLID